MHLMLIRLPMLINKPDELYIYISRCCRGYAKFPDVPTAELMTEFYTNVYQKKFEKAQGLLQAMLKTMEKQRDNPRAWVAFNFIDEAELLVNSYQLWKSYLIFLGSTCSICTF